MKKINVYLKSDQGLITFVSFQKNVHDAISNACNTLLLPVSSVLRTTFEDLETEKKSFKKTSIKNRFSMRAEFLPKLIV